MNALLKNVSFFPCATATDNPTNGTFFQIVTSEKLAAKYGPAIERIRQTSDKKERDELKFNLPCLTPSGTFSHRAAAGLLAHSGLMQFDIDPKENPELDAVTAPLWRDKISNLRHVAYCALSASGKGIWGVVPIAHPDHHTAHFAALKADFVGWGIAIDEGCGNVDRLRYWSHDPDAYFNLDAATYTKTKSIQDAYTPRSTPRLTGLDFEQKKVECILEQLDGRRADITDGGNGYNIWFSIGCGFAGMFGESGRDYFHRASQYYPKYCTAKTNLQFTHCLQWKGAANATLDTFFAHTRLIGVTYKGQLGPATTPRYAPPEPPPTAHVTPMHVVPMPRIESPATAAPNLPNAHLPIIPGHHRERYTDRNTGQNFEVLLNAEGYPAAWDLPDDQRESLACVIRANPAVTELIARFDMKFEGWQPLTDESEKDWQQATARAQQIVSRAASKQYYDGQKQQVKTHRQQLHKVPNSL